MTDPSDQYPAVFEDAFQTPHLLAKNPSYIIASHDGSHAWQQSCQAYPFLQIRSEMVPLLRTLRYVSACKDRVVNRVILGLLVVRFE